MELPKVPRLRPRAILSDADGTLVDTVGLIRHGQYETAKAYLEKQGVAAESLPSYEIYEGYLNQVVGGGSPGYTRAHRQTFVRASATPCGGV